MSLKLNKEQITTAIVQYLTDLENAKQLSATECRNCHVLYLPLAADDLSVSVCLRCRQSDSSNPENIFSINGVETK